MNKKQKKVTWIAGVLVCLSLFFPLTAVNRINPEKTKSFTFEQIGIIVIIAIILIILLRNKNKNL